MTYTPKQVLLKFYEEEGKYTKAPPESRDFSAVAACFADDYYMEQSSALPWAGTYHGPDGMKSFLDKASQHVTIDVQQAEIFESEGSDKVMVYCQVNFVALKSGKADTFPMAQMVRIDRERGLIKEIRAFYWDIRKLNEQIEYSSKV